MTNTFRIDASEVRAWHEASAKRVDVRGVAALAKELEAHLARQGSDGTVVVSRHQLFTWAEALSGAASRGAPELSGSAGEMRAILGGKRSSRAVDTPSNPTVASTTAWAVAGHLPPPRIEAAQERPLAAPPVVYGASPASSAHSGVRVVPAHDLAATVREMVRGARGELLVASPWSTGIETLVPDLVALPPAVRVLIVSRRPEREDAAFHQSLDQLGRRRAVTAFSNHIQTRLIVQDDERALVGAASIPGAASREAGVLLNDRDAVAAVRAHFERVHAEAAGGKY